MVRVPISQYGFNHLKPNVHGGQYCVRKTPIATFGHSLHWTFTYANSLSQLNWSCPKAHNIRAYNSLLEFEYIQNYESLHLELELNLI